MLQSVHVALAAEVDPAGPYRPAAHAEPEHVEAPVIADDEVTRVRRGTYTTHQTAEHPLVCVRVCVCVLECLLVC